MKLTELEARFLIQTADGKHLHEVDSIEKAKGVMFLCPACWQRNEGPVGTHSVLIWFAGRGVPDSATPGPGRWQVSGTCLDDLTLSPSVNLDCGPEPRGCRWHGWVQNGEAR